MSALALWRRKVLLDQMNQLDRQLRLGSLKFATSCQALGRTSTQHAGRATREESPKQTNGLEWEWNGGQFLSLSRGRSGLRWGIGGATWVLASRWGSGKIWSFRSDRLWAKGDQRERTAEAAHRKPGALPGSSLRTIRTITSERSSMLWKKWRRIASPAADRWDRADTTEKIFAA